MNCFHLCSCGHKLDIEADTYSVLVMVLVVVMVVPSMRTGFGWTLRMLTSVVYISVDTDRTAHGFSSIHKLCDDCGWGSSHRDEEGDRHDLAQVPNLTKGHTACRTL